MLARSWSVVLGWCWLLCLIVHPNCSWNGRGWCALGSVHHHAPGDGSEHQHDVLPIPNEEKKHANDGKRNQRRDVKVCLHASWPKVNVERSDPHHKWQLSHGGRFKQVNDANHEEEENTDGRKKDENGHVSIRNMRKLKEKLRTHAPEWEARRKDAETDRMQAGEEAQQACCWLRHGQDVYVDPKQYRPDGKEHRRKAEEHIQDPPSHTNTIERTVYSMDPTWDVWMDQEEWSGTRSSPVPWKMTSHASQSSSEGLASTSNSDVPDVVRLHAPFGSACFHAFHQKLLPAHRAGHITYLMRPHHGLWGKGTDGRTIPCDAPMENVELEEYPNKTALFGFGVELAIKNTEYQAKNDDGGKEKVQDGTGDPEEIANDFSSGDTKAGVELLEQVLQLGASNMDKDIPSPQALNLIGLKIAAMISNSTEPLQVLETTTQNLPYMVRGLETVSAKRSVQKQVEAIRSTFGDGGQFLLVNEQAYSLDNLDVFGIVQYISEELDFVNGLEDSGLPGELLHKAIAVGQEEMEELLVEPRSEYLFTVNDLERDDRYKGWSRSLSSLLSFTMPGQFQPIRRNTCLVVFSVDPATIEGAEILVSMSTFLRRLIPVQFGIYLIVPAHLKALQEETSHQFAIERKWDDLTLSDQISRAFHYIQDIKGGKIAFEFLVMVARLITKANDIGQLKWFDIEPFFLKQWSEKPSEIGLNIGKTAHVDALLALKGGSGAQAAFAMTSQAFRKGLSEDLPFAVVNGRVFPKLYQLQYALSLCLQMQQSLLEAIYTGIVAEEDDVLAWIFEGSVPKYNKDILEERDSGVNNVGFVFNKGSCLHEFIPSTDYLHSPGTEEMVKIVTQLVVLDFSSGKGQRLALETVDWILQSSSHPSRVAFLPNPAERNNISLLQRVVMAFQAAPSRRTKIAPFFAALFKNEELLAVLKQTHADESSARKLYSLVLSAGLNADYLRDALSEGGAFSESKSMEMQHKLSRCLSKMLDLQAGVNAIITNSRLHAIGEGTRPFTSSDMNLMLVREKLKSSGLDILLTELLERPELLGEEEQAYTTNELSDLALQLSSSLANRPASRQKIDTGKVMEALEMVDERVKLLNTTVALPGNPNLDILAMIDPFSPKARKLATILRFLKQHLDVGMKIFLNPSSSPSVSQLSSFYRYLLPQEESGQEDVEFVRFTDMPVDKVLTMNVDVPENWLVAPVEAEHDLDNILLQDLKENETLNASFELDSLLVTGSCIDRSAKSQKDLTPRGVQLHLGNTTDAHVTDTLVMSNLGYFQLKSSPGHWMLSLAPGRSRELFTIPVTDQNTPSTSVPPDVFETPILVKDFTSSHMQFFVQKRPGKEGEDVLDEMPSGSVSYLTKISRLVRPSKKEDERVHVFSIASGHLYERLLKIMILSVLRTTHSPVKFWFIRNYFSPSFAAYMPYMAEDYGFEFEFITYKWPSWLHKQTEKQRIIWAYKILFLDVIFPLSLQRVIFVDADQVVRSDLKELMDMNLQGAPYAYTPFCDNNKDMDGYRFWKQGFWKEHLQGKPYHISALYVVDLKRFRETAAGDQLRVVYDQLSKDPNSLSNLDQDLPNYVQHQVPIFSLPQQWLWCESWCGNETKAAAKTIDLCNNPMTKEPKLTAARRIVAEWPTYDQEVQHHTFFVANLIQEGIIPGAERKRWNYTAEKASLREPVEHTEL